MAIRKNATAKVSAPVKKAAHPKAAAVKKTAPKKKAAAVDPNQPKKRTKKCKPMPGADDLKACEPKTVHLNIDFYKELLAQAEAFKNLEDQIKDYKEYTEKLRGKIVHDANTFLQYKNEALSPAKAYGRIMSILQKQTPDEQNATIYHVINWLERERDNRFEELEKKHEDAAKALAKQREVMTSFRKIKDDEAAFLNIEPLPQYPAGCASRVDATAPEVIDLKYTSQWPATNDLQKSFFDDLGKLRDAANVGAESGSKLASAMMASKSKNK